VARHLLEHGPLGLWQGCSPVLFRAIIADALYFLVSGRIEESARRVVRRQLGAAEAILCGVLSACACNLVCHPIDLVCQRAMCDPERRPVRWHLGELIRTLGMFGLWRGISASFVLSLIPALQFTAFERLKQLTRASTSGQLFALGVVTKICTLSTVYPLIRGKVRLQANLEKPGADGGDARPTFVGALREVVQHEGLEGLFKGWSGQIAKSAVGSAVAATSKEKITGMMRGLVLKLILDFEQETRPAPGGEWKRVEG
jgi:hypothetical protein